MRLLMLVLALASVPTVHAETPRAASSVALRSPYGRYIGDVITKWNGDNRTMTLERDFAFVDPLNVTWKAPRGSVVDGASIPQWAWSLIGGPFEGPYRPASVVHDVACAEKTAPWESVHLMFYYAMLVSGVPERLAKVMYGAVYLGGPRWTIQAEKKFASAQDLKFVARELDEKSDSNDRVQVEVGFRDRMEEAARTVKYEGRAQDVVDQLNRGNALPNSAQTFYVDSIKVISIERGQLDEAGFKKLRRFIESNNPSLEQIRAFKP